MIIKKTNYFCTSSSFFFLLFFFNCYVIILFFVRFISFFFIIFFFLFPYFFSLSFLFCIYLWNIRKYHQCKRCDPKPPQWKHRPQCHQTSTHSSCLSLIAWTSQTSPCWCRNTTLSIQILQTLLLLNCRIDYYYY